VKRVFLLVCLSVCLLASTAQAQQPESSARGGDRTVILDISVLEVSAERAEEIEKLVKDKATLDRLIMEGKAQAVAGVQMRARSGKTAAARIGQRVPIQTATVPAINPQPDRQREGAVVSVGIPQISYENTGLNVDATPRVVGGGQVEVILRLEMTGLAKETGSLTPTFVQRTFNNTVSVREGETAVLLGVVQNESLWPSSRVAAQPQGQSRGSFVVLLTARVQD
jgi:hypothetical protein